jgi:hypothetical protein
MGSRFAVAAMGKTLFTNTGLDAAEVEVRTWAGMLVF